ncbi:hypothetical protein BDV96DRAFT_317780 [Lophiotrema nucula]|uniref:Rhodopsin domain-containing protein n=1 Tax=Lophiotrema nucula TaxID=690887 RepID=A0A6A5ZP60_9PLEO|nr:hypothetical protein BDV96DRAFT_317780 [Lophiotrema nucula]
MELRRGGSGTLSTYRARVLIGVAIAFTLTSTTSLVLRFVGKRIKKTKFSAEDWLIVLAQVAVYALAITTILEVVLGGAGHPSADVPSKVPNALKILVACQCLYAVSLALIKVSICIFYNRIFQFRSFRIASWSIIAGACAWAVGAILYAFLVCRPLSYFWDPAVTNGTCVGDTVKPYIIVGALDVAIDTAMVILPLPMIWRLRVSMADKVALFCIFGAGISILRVEAFMGVNFGDSTYTGAYALLWSFAEPAISISVACAPFFRPIFHRIFQKAFQNPDIEMRSPSPRFWRIRASKDSVPSFVNPSIRVGRGVGTEGSYVAMQFVEPGNWRQASLHHGRGEK